MFNRKSMRESVQYVPVDPEGDGIGQPQMDAAWRLAKDSGINILRDKGLSMVALAPDGTVVGALWSTEAGRQFSFDVAVHPQWRRMGIGARLAQEGKSMYDQEAYPGGMELDAVSEGGEGLAKGLGLNKVREAPGHKFYAGAKEVPQSLEPFAAVHQSKKTQPGDFQNEVQRIVTQVLNPTDMANPDDDEHADASRGALDVLNERAFKEPYWNYVWHFDPDYRDELAKAANHMIKRFRMMPDAQKKMVLDKMAPQGAKPQAPQGGAGGGMGGGAPPPPGAAPGGAPPPPMAASNRATKVANHSMYLTKGVGRYKLRGSLASNLAAGTLQYMRGDGALYVLRGPKDVAMSRSGPSPAATTLIETEMPGAVLDAMVEALSSTKVPDPQATAKAIADRAWATGQWDLMPASVAMGGVMVGFMLAEHAGQEPGEVSAMRKAIGGAMGPYVDRLISALRNEGVAVAEKALPMPSCTEAGRAQRDGQDANKLHSPDQPADRANPSVLGAGDASHSTDVPSLVMTIANPGADAGAKENSIRRLIEVVCKYPECYEPHKLSEEEAARIAARCPECRHAGALVRFVKLFDADDADLMEAYVQAGGPMEKSLISHIVSSQWRKDIMDAVPEMAVQASPGGAIVNNEFLGALDMSDPSARKVVAAILSSGARKVADNLLNRKVMEALSKSGNGSARRDDPIARLALGRGGSARYFAMAWLLGGDEADKSMAMDSLRHMERDSDPHSYRQRALACVAFIQAGLDEAGRLAWRILGVLPKDVAFLGTNASGYMGENRIDHDGGRIPDALQFHSLPDDCEQLAKNLITISDTPGMLSLLHLCAKHLDSHPKDGDVRRVGEMLQDALDGVGKGDVAGEVMPTEHRSAMLADGSVMVSRGGVHEVDGVCFASSQSDARRIATLLISKGKMASADK